MQDLKTAKYVQLTEQNGQYILVLLDQDKAPVGQGYKGPTLKRAQADLKYWIRDKGLEEIPA